MQCSTFVNLLNTAKLLASLGRAPRIRTATNVWNSSSYIRLVIRECRLSQKVKKIGNGRESDGRVRTVRENKMTKILLTTATFTCATTLLFVVVTTSAFAVDYRWNFEMAGGTETASIDNKFGSELSSECQSGMQFNIPTINLESK